MTQKSESYSSLQVTQTLVTPTGLTLRSATPSLNPRDASIAFNNTTKRLVYGAENVWKGIVDGPTVSVVDRLATYQSTDGQTIKDASGITALAGNLTGVLNINGIAIANIVTNVGGAVVSDSIPTFDGTTGKIIKGINSITIDNSNNIANVNNLNGIAVANFVKNTTVGAVTNGSVPVFDLTTGRIIKGGNNVLIDTSSNITGVNSLTLTGTRDIANLLTLNGTGVIVPQPFGATPNANGMSVSANPGQQLTLQPASTSFPGGVTTGAQSFAGLKDFSTNGIALTASPVTAGLTRVLDYFAASSAPIAMLWTGAFAVPVADSVGFERIGNTIIVKFPVTLDPGAGNMAAGIMISTTAFVTVEFRPSVDRISEKIVLNGGNGAALPGNSIFFGDVKLRADGFIEIGVGINNAGTLGAFGGVSVNGGNGYMQETCTFCV
jgi:hypothetical protein